MTEKYTAEVSARKILERIKGLLAQGVSTPLEKKAVIEGFGGTLWNRRESDAIDFDAGFDFLTRCRILNFVDRERFEITEYIDTFAPKAHTPPPLPIQINRQLENEAENMQHCYRWLYIFENTLRNFIYESLLERYGENWFDKLNPQVKSEIEGNEKRWRGGIPPRNRLEFTTLSTLHRVINKEWEDEVFREKFKNTNPASLHESLERIEGYRNTIAHSRMLTTEEESSAFYQEIRKVLSSIR